MSYEHTVKWLKQQGLKMVLEGKMSSKQVHARMKAALEGDDGFVFVDDKSGGAG